MAVHRAVRPRGRPPPNATGRQGRRGSRRTARRLRPGAGHADDPREPPPRARRRSSPPADGRWRRGRQHQDGRRSPVRNGSCRCLDRRARRRCGTRHWRPGRTRRRPGPPPGPGRRAPAHPGGSPVHYAAPFWSTHPRGATWDQSPLRARRHWWASSPLFASRMDRHASEFNHRPALGPSGRPEPDSRGHGPLACRIRRCLSPRARAPDQAADSQTPSPAGRMFPRSARRYAGHPP